MHTFTTKIYSTKRKAVSAGVGSVLNPMGAGLIIVTVPMPRSDQKSLNYDGWAIGADMWNALAKVRAAEAA